MANDNNGGRRNGPPDLDDIMRKLWLKVSRWFGGRPSPDSKSPNPTGIIIGVLLGLWLASGFYLVDEGQQGVIFRLGSYNRSTQPGLHWHLPYPVESRELVKLSEIHALTISTRQDEPGMLTADQRLVAASFLVQYAVNNAKDLLLNTAVNDDLATDDVVKPLAEAAIRQAVANTRFDQMTQGDHLKVSTTVQRQLQALLDTDHVGIRVTQISVSAAEPPDQLRADFADVDTATKDGQRLREEARAYADDLAARSKNTVAQQLQQAQDYRQQAKVHAQSDSSSFLQVLAEYKQAPQVTRDRLYFDTMQEILSNTTKVLIDQKPGSTQVLYLPLDKLTPVNLGDAAHAATAAIPAAPTRTGSPAASAAATSDGDNGRNRDRDAR